MSDKNSTGGIINSDSQDEFQQRYLAHQQLGKREELIAIMKERHSNRRFDDREVEQELIDEILEACKHAPSSCDRFGVRIKIVTDRDEKALLNGLLVGAVGWIYRSPSVFLLLANPEAYKARNELQFMPYLDAGILAQQIMLVSTAQGLHSAFSNPNMLDYNIPHFKAVFKPENWSDVIMCGAVAVGYPHPEPIEKHRNLIEDITV
jgi:nitroreductase